jgi:hypothetical protein
MTRPCRLLPETVLMARLTKFDMEVNPVAIEVIEAVEVQAALLHSKYLIE